MKRYSKFFVGFLSMIILSVSVLSGCGKSSSKIIIDLGSLMPTANTTATVDHPEVIQASKYIIQDYVEHKGVNIEWALDYGRSSGDSVEKTTSWYNIQINTDNCPLLGYTGLNLFQDMDYYVTLDEYLNRPNPYVAAGQPGSIHWKDMFYDYVWDNASIKNIKGEIVAIPLLLSVGTQTGIYYNKNIIDGETYTVPSNWDEFKNLVEILKSGEGYSNPFVPTTSYTKAGLYQWALNFNIAPNVLKAMESIIDYDKDGKVTNLEVLRGVKEGFFDPREVGYAQSVYDECYTYYSETLTKGWNNFDSATNWANGRVAMLENGLWNIPIENSNTGRKNIGKFDYGIFCPPLADNVTFGEYAMETEYYDSFENVKNPVSVGINIMKPAVEKNPELLETAIDLLMYLTTVENNSAMASEKGGTMGAVKGSTYNTLVDDSKIGWKSQQFPIISYSCQWPNCYTAERTGKIDDEFEKWVNADTNITEIRSEFFEKLNSEQQAGADEFIRIFNIDTTGWNIN